MKSELIMWDDVGLLDYIGYIEDRYMPEYDTYEYADNFQVSIEMVGDDDLSEEEQEMLDTRPVEASECKDIFTERYNANLIKRKNDYDTYRKELGRMVEQLGLDADKFWFLSLFILDYCESMFYLGKSFKPTPFEQLYGLYDAISQCEDEPMTLKFKCGKRKAELDSTIAIKVIASLIEDFNEELNQEDSKTERLRTLLNQRERKEEADMISDSPIIAYFANMFLGFFDTQSQICSQRKKGVKHTKTEMELVSKLIYLTGLSTNENWNDIEFEYLKAFLKQYKDYRYPNNASSVYPEFNI